MPNFANYNQTEAKMSDGFEPVTPGAFVLRVRLCARSGRSAIIKLALTSLAAWQAKQA